MQYKVFDAYPRIGETILGRDFGIYKALGLRLNDLLINEKEIKAAVDEVTYYLNSLKITSSDELRDLIQRVSGYLWVEYETIEDLLMDNEG